MKRITKTIDKISKILLIFMLSISQFSFPLEVLAEELNDEIEVAVQEELTEKENPTEIEEEILTGTEGESPLETAEDSNELDEGTTVPGEESTETEGENTTSKYELAINGEKVTEYTIKESDNKFVKITQNYYGEEGTYVFDNLEEEIYFTNKLYGDYQYTYSVSTPENEILETKDILIHYEGDNSEILSSYTELKYVDGKYFVKGSKELLSTSDVLANFNTEGLKTDYASDLVITDLEDELLIETDTVMNGYKLIMSNGVITETYLLVIEGDYNDDSLVNEEDSHALIDKILKSETNELNNGKPFDILDATNPVFTTGSWENNAVSQDSLINSLQNREEMLIDEELQVKYYITGFEFDNLTGIQGKINYDTELLELINVEINSVYGNINEEGKFAYLLDNYQSNGILMTLTFTSLNAGEAMISIDEIISSTGIQAELDGDSISTVVTILDYGKGGDIEEETESTSPATPETNTKVETPQPTISVPTKTTTVTRVTLSSDNFIKALSIKGYNIEFKKDTYEYAIKVKNNVKSLDLTIELNDEKATYTVDGNSNFKVGENIVTITVKAEDGSTKTYTLKVTREEDDEETTEEDVEEKNSSKTIVIILIVLVIIGLIYVIFKDDEEDKKESKK